MIGEQKVVVIMPAYNASKTLVATYAEIPFDIVDEVLLVDDFSRDDTAKIATEIGIRHVIKHEQNKGST